MAENNYNVKVPLDSQDLPTTDGAVVFNTTDKQFEIRDIDDLRSTNICIEYQIMDNANTSDIVPGWTYEEDNLSSTVPANNKFAAQSATTPNGVQYPPESYNGENPDAVYFGYNTTSEYSTYLRNVANSVNNKIIMFASNNNFPEQFFALEGEVTQVGAGVSGVGSQTRLVGCHFLDYQYSPSRNNNINLSTTNTSNNFFATNTGNGGWKWIFLDPDVHGNGKFTSGASPSSVHGTTKNLILTAKDLNGNDVKEYLVAEGGGTIKFTDKSNDENYIIKRFQRSFILRGDTKFPNTYYVVFTNMETIASRGSYEDPNATYCVEVTPNDLGNATNTTGGTPNAVYTPWVIHRQRFQTEDETLRVGRRYEGGYRGGNPYGFADGLLGAEVKINCWVNSDDSPEVNYRSMGTFNTIYFNSPNTTWGAIINTYVTNVSDGQVLAPQNLFYISSVGGYLLVKFTNNNPVLGAENSTGWPTNPASSAWVITRMYFTNRN